jgi:monoamine oxidase
LIHDWRYERFTSPPAVVRLIAYHTFGHSIYAEPQMNGRLHWASTETAQENPGHIEGALAAAERAADAVTGNKGKNYE